MLQEHPVTVCCSPDLVDECRSVLEEDFFRAFIDESRLKIFLILMEKGELTVSGVSGEIDIDQSNVSRHLAFLKRAGVAVSNRNGRET
ncbi:MAG: ArsR/SmtB family transcription factor, partial [Fidelibacterota bacterium]